ncbi:nuclear transport factor 2 family protein [Rhodococcus sp. CH91]|uniref:nuclear transport factor 2 family protein n=1 Tax=Rhodococcus sp. CH91 TaxID=2910256 RepID=UPI001F4AC5B2|nr:nuclear transport factor 2 family protein [Rhodococcus sp. CH91]
MTDSTIARCPDAVRAYMTLATGDDRPAATVLFAEDAHVTDDGVDHRGRDGIRTWLDRVAGEFSYTTTPVSVYGDAHSDRVTIRCRIEGDFPGGVVDLDYDFRLDTSGRIASLVIAPATDLG